MSAAAGSGLQGYRCLKRVGRVCADEEAGIAVGGELGSAYSDSGPGIGRTGGERGMEESRSGNKHCHVVSKETTSHL